MPDRDSPEDRQKEMDQVRKIHQIRMSQGIVTVVDRSIDIIAKLVLLVPQTLSETANSVKMVLEEQLEELHDTAGQIDESLDKLREGKETEMSEKDRIKLHKKLARGIRRYVYLSQKRIKNTYDKLRNIIVSKRTADILPEWTPMEILKIHTDAASGIDTVLLTRLLKKPLGDFFLVIRWIRNRLHCFACGGSLYAPHLTKGRCPAAIDFDDSPLIIPEQKSVPPTDDANTKVWM